MCVLSDEPEQKLFLSLTKGASLSEAPPLTEATATLYDNQRVVGRFQHKEGNEWTLSYAAVHNNKYRLEVEVPGYDLIYAEQTMPRPELAFYRTYGLINSYVEPYSGWIIIVLDPNHPYELLNEVFLWPEDEEAPPVETWYILPPSSSSVWLYGVNVDPETGQRQLAREICASIPSDTINLTGYYYKPLQKDVPMPFKVRDGLPLTESVRAAHLQELYPPLAGEPLHDSFLRIPAHTDTQVFYVSGSFTGTYYGQKDWDNASSPLYSYGYFSCARISEADNKGYLLCMTPSADYDRFLKEAYSYRRIKESSDLSTIYLRDNLYSNITGGIGLFGAKVERMLPWHATYSYIDTGISRRPLGEDMVEGYFDWDKYREK